jgi:hypothetical protein
MDHADDGGDNDDGVFIYMGGSVPHHLRETITHVRVHKSVKIITWSAFQYCAWLVSIEMHDGVEIIEHHAFSDCASLRGIKLTGVRVIEKFAFVNCTALAGVEFGDKLETIGDGAFAGTALRNIKIPKVRSIANGAFAECKQLTDAELLSKDIETIEGYAFESCPRLRRIAIPLKKNLLCNNAFTDCDILSQVDLVGGIHKTISSLLLDSWRNEMSDLIDRINRDLPNIHYDKTFVIRRWMERVLERIRHYKSEHYALLKNNMAQLELALWKSNLPNVGAAESRHEARVTCGANIIIPHVLSFLNDDDVFPLLDYGQH